MWKLKKNNINFFYKTSFFWYVAHCIFGNTEEKIYIEAPKKNLFPIEQPIVQLQLFGFETFRVHVDLTIRMVGQTSRATVRFRFETYQFVGG